MIKRFITTILLFLILSGLVGAFFIYRYHEQQVKRQNAKAPEETVTIIEGWTTGDIASYLQKKGIAQANVFISAQNDFDTAAFPLLKDKPQGAGLEGYIFPDTYRILKTAGTGQDQAAASLGLVKKAVENFSGKFTVSMQRQASEQGLTVYQAVTLASIIERETGRNVTTQEQRQQLQEERRIISGIFYNRLKAGQPLQSDATVNFITKKNTPSASAADISIDSPYNTYKHKGLPPGPICNPSLSSLVAAVNPEKTEYQYFLHKQPSGEPVFSKTFDEHVRNKNKYLK